MTEEHHTIICGLDEAGRGSLAGPIVAAAVIVPEGISEETLTQEANAPLRDSKTLSPLQRKRLFEAIRTLGIDHMTETISPADINTHGIGWANVEVFRKLISRIDAHEYIVDGAFTFETLGDKSTRVSSIPRADTTHIEVMLASIVAKVTRDAILFDLHRDHPDYAWDSNKGYGTKTHVTAIHRHGITPHHRIQFVNSVLKNKSYR